MISEPFEVTDDNGITVKGTVDVSRDPDGDYYNPAKPEHYLNPRFANSHFDYFNTREACTIDRNVLSAAMQEALRKALERFGIEGPKPGNIADQINSSINAMRHQCTLNADKYVSNETSSSMNWETGKAVGELSATAYGVVPAAGGGFQRIVARENAWPADAVSPNGGDIRVLARRGNDDRSSLTNSNRFSAGGPGYPLNPPMANAAATWEDRLPDDENQVPHLTRSFDDRPRVSTSYTGVSGSSLGPPMELSPLDHLTSFRNRLGNGATSPAGVTPRNPNLPGPGGPLGIVAGQSMPLWTTPSIFGSFDSSAASIPFSRSTEPFSSRPGNAVDDRSAAFFPTDDAANTPNAPIGLAGRIAALAALNPGSPERPTSLSRNGGLQSVNNDDELSWLIQLLSRRQR